MRATSVLTGLLVLYAGLARADEAWIEVSSPSEGETVRAATGIVELRGRVGRGAHRAYDVVIALDQSQSTLLPTGLDLDRDGVLGTFVLPGEGMGVCGPKNRFARTPRCAPFRKWTTDFDDVVAKAERTLAQGLLTQLEAQGARVALVSFTDKVRIGASLGPPEKARAALEKLAIREDWNGSDISAAVKQSVRLLRNARDGEAREPVVLLVTDGMPTAPLSEEVAAEEALRAAENARDARVGLYIFQICSHEDVDTALLAEMAELHGGRRIYVDAPERLAFTLPSPSFAPVEAVEIHNRTLERAARAVRVFPGGAFDAFVPVAPGENALEISARLPDGSRRELRRTVYFEQPERAHPGDTQRMQALLDELRRRTLETEHGLRPSEVEPDYRSLQLRVARDGEAVDTPAPDADPDQDTTPAR